jgi:hypothetical protein
MPSGHSHPFLPDRVYAFIRQNLQLENAVGQGIGGEENMSKNTNMLSTLSPFSMAYTEMNSRVLLYPIPPHSECIIPASKANAIPIRRPNIIHSR